MKIKICGMKYPENIANVASLGIDYMGFIFYRPSQRFIGDNFDAANLCGFSGKIRKTGVFVNESIINLCQIAENYELDYIQLHGNEPPDYCETVQSKGHVVIKAFSVGADIDFERLEAYESSSDYFLFDTPAECYGGSGITFNWQLLEKYNLKTPFFLSGGLGLHNIDQVLQLNHPMLYGLDFNSRLEIKPGLKNTHDIALLINKIKNYERI